MNKKYFKIFFLVLLIIEFIIFIYILAITYHGAMDNGIFTVLFCSAVFCGITWYREKSKNTATFIYIIVILVGLPIILYLFKPQYTYKEAQNIIYEANKEKQNFFITNEKRVNMLMENDRNFFINKCYIVKVNKNGEMIDYFFDPIDGCFEVIQHISHVQE